MGFERKRAGYRQYAMWKKNGAEIQLGKGKGDQYRRKMREEGQITRLLGESSRTHACFKYT